MVDLEGSPLLSLQRRRMAATFGSALAAPATPSAVVQRYYASTDFAAKDVQPDMFSSQSVKPEIREKSGQETPEGQLPWAFEYPRVDTPLSEVNLRVADDDSMALQANEAEPKEFYARPDVVEASNDKLDDVGSSFALEMTSAQIRLGGSSLQKVRPVNRVTLDEAKRYTDMLENICIKISGHVIGTGGSYGRSVVLGSKDEGWGSATISPNATGDEGVLRLADYLSREGVATPEGAQDAMMSRDELDKSSVGERYGRALGRGDLTDKARLLGVNEFARPEVGQGLGTFGTPGPEPNLDYSKLLEGGLPTNRGDTWGYHFAGVVAHAPKAGDYVTLENYNRGVDMEVKLRELHTRILESYGHGLWSWWNSLSIEEKDDETAVREKFSQLAKGITNRHGVHEYFRLQQEAKPNEKWFFYMYGTGQGQSFHEKQAASGEFVNPITVTVKKNDLWVSRLRTELDQLPPRLTADAFEDDSRPGVADRLDPVRQRVVTLLKDELRTAIDAGVQPPSLVSAVKFERMLLRSQALNEPVFKEARSHLRGLLSQGSQKDYSAAMAVLDALSELGLPKWWV